jgi:hypothetical protein
MMQPLTKVNDLFPASLRPQVSAFI